MRSESLLALAERSLRRSVRPLLLLCASTGLTPQTTSAQSLLYQFQVPSGGFDGAGNLLTYSDSVNGNWTLQYDGLNRLLGGTSSTGPYSGLTLQESYDSYGNRWAQNASQAQGSTPTVAVNSTWAQYNLANNQITKSSTAINAMPYDPAGKIQSDDNYSYAYDGEDRLCAVRRNYDGSVTQYIYDAEGRRTGKVSVQSSSGPLTCFVPGSATVPSTNYLYDPEGHQMTEIDGSGKWQRTHVYAGGTLLATYDQQGLHYAVADPLGSIRMHVGAATGAVEETISNLPFGELPTNQPTYEPTDLHFTGKEHDTESGLDYFGARFYSSSLGRWLSPDWADKPEATPYSELSDPQSLNLYRYVDNNPLRSADADGHCYPVCTVVAGILVGAAAETIREAAAGQGFSGGRIAAAAAGGGVAGLIGPAGAAAELGVVGTVVSLAGGSVLGDAAENIVNAATSGKQETPAPLTPEGAITDVITAGASDTIGRQAAKIAQPAVKMVLEQAGNVIIDANRRITDDKRHPAPAPTPKPSPPTPKPPAPPPPPPPLVKGRQNS